MTGSDIQCLHIDGECAKRAFRYCRTIGGLSQPANHPQHGIFFEQAFVRLTETGIVLWNFASWTLTMYFRVPLARVPSSSSLRQLQRLEWPLAQEQSFAILSS